ncbi:MAG: peptidoglycan recognition protein family protein [Patescibacteria group bacterium]|nr:peptidoglycan recognition protein family protein [Patescibacteria group bacterium]
MEFFDENEWKEKIKDPLWYIEVPMFIEKLLKLRNQDENQYKATIEEIYNFFEKQLISGNVFLGSVIKDFDNDRREIDTIVIHHTHNEKGMANERLSAMELLRLYAPYFATTRDEIIKGKAIYSGHFRDGKQVFYSYHWIIRKDGRSERLLNDNEIGWHAGKWDVNCRSIAIVFDGDYENRTPSEIELKSAANLIKEKYPAIKKNMVVGHREVNPKTTCPSNLFLSKNVKTGWKEDLLALL